MRKQILKFLILNLIAVGLISVSTAEAQNRPYKVRDSQVQYILNRIETRTDYFKRQLNTALDRSTLNGTDNEDRVMEYVTNFENATDALKQKFEAKESVSADVSDVLTRAAYINEFLKTNRLTTTTQSGWTNLRTDLNTLARYYSITGDWTKVAVTGGTVSVPYRVSDTQVASLLGAIETKTDIYKRDLDRALDRSVLNNSNREDNILNYIKNFENSTDQLKQRFEDKKSVVADVQEVLNRAYFIDGFMKDNRLNRRAENDWTSLKTDLNTLAGYYNVSWNWTAPTTNNNTAGNNTSNTSNVSENDVRTTLASIESRTNLYKQEMTTALNRSVLNGTQSERSVNNYIAEFENSTDSLKQRFNSRRATSTDVEAVLDKAYYIDGFMRDYRFDRRAEREWRLIRTDLEKLRDYYRVSFNFDNRQYEPITKFDQMLTGTYRLNVRESDNVSEVVDRAIQFYPANQRDKYEANLERRLSAPEMLAIEKRDKTVKVASSNAPQINFEADGVARTETMSPGRTIKITANTLYDGVSVSYEADRTNDFYVNFMPMSNGKLKVVRRVYLEDKNDTITVASVYDKTNDTAQFSMVNNGTVAGGTNNGSTINNTFYIPNNTPITASLKTPISTEASQNNDRFQMEITSPSMYDGAMIEGRVIKAERSGRVSGSANISLEFDTIRLRNGETYKFAGIVSSVKALNGDDVKVNNEGTVKDSSQTNKTVTRAGIGAALGALIGAIAGGGQGAIIGAGVGAGAGAGTVLLEGRDDIKLEEGSQFLITATAPASVGTNR